MERKSSKVQKNTQLFFGGRRKVEVTNLPLLSVLPAANLVGTTLKFTAFDSGPDTKPSRASA